MKTIKSIFWLVILGLLGLIIYQNIDYFMAKAALTIDLKVSSWHWTTPQLPAIAYWALCFGLGLLITGIKGLFTAFRLGREIKNKDAAAVSLEQEIARLKTRLDVFTHDPYIKKNIDDEQNNAPEQKEISPAQP